MLKGYIKLFKRRNFTSLMVPLEGELLAVKEVSMLEGSKGREAVSQIEQEVR